MRSVSVRKRTNALMIKTGFCSAFDLAGPRTSGWRILVLREVPSGVRPVCETGRQLCSHVVTAIESPVSSGGSHGMGQRDMSRGLESWERGRATEKQVTRDRDRDRDRKETYLENGKGCQ